MNGRRSLPPTVGATVAVGMGDHGVSDPTVVVGDGPAIVLAGRSRHGLPAIIVNRLSHIRPDEGAPPVTLICASRAGEFPEECCSVPDPRCGRASRDPRDSWPSRVRCCAVLGGVQGSPLRFDRALARPPGLDAASAQLLSRQIRDGRHCDRACGSGGTRGVLPRSLSAWFESSFQLLVVFALHVLREFEILLCAVRRRIDVTGICDRQDNPVTDP